VCNWKDAAEGGSSLLTCCVPHMDEAGIKWLLPPQLSGERMVVKFTQHPKQKPVES